MHAFKWRLHNSRHFGPQWVPFAEVTLKASSGRWRTISMQLDTGAAITVVPLALGRALVGKPDSGEPIELTSVASGPRRYFIHHLAARVGPAPEFAIRIAVAERDDVPTLLGRLDVLDRFQIELDASHTETRFLRCLTA